MSLDEGIGATEFRRAVSSAVCETVARTLSLDIRNVHLSADLCDDLGVDMATGPLVWLALEEAFEVDLDDEFEPGIARSVSDVVDRVAMAVLRVGLTRRGRESDYPSLSPGAEPSIPGPFPGPAAGTNVASE
jgi:hypothetical protein